MNQELIDELLGKLELIAQKLGIAAEYIWEFMVRRQVVDGIVDIGLGVLLLVGVYICYRIARWGFKYEVEGHYDDKGDAAAVVGTIVGVILLIIAVIVLQDGIRTLLVPEYGAFQDLLKMLR